MKKILITFQLVLIIGLCGFTQDKEFTKPDYQTIKQEISDRQSDFYYPALFERFENNDTTLTHKDYRMLYYGYIFQDDYSPNDRSSYRDSLQALYEQDTLVEKDYRKIIRFEKGVLQNDPFSMRDLNTLAYSYSQTGEQEMTKKVDYKLNLIIETILSTGKGLKESNAWHVIEVSHEYDILNVLGFQFKGEQSLRGEKYDYLKIKENRYGIPGFYFNVGQMLKKQQE